MQQQFKLTLPKQRIHSSKKTDTWKHENVDAIIASASTTNKYGRTNRQDKEDNYDLVNSNYENIDFKYILDPYNSGRSEGEAPARMRGYNIIRSQISALVGEELKLPFAFSAVAVNGTIISEKRQKKSRAILDAAIEQLNKAFPKPNGTSVDTPPLINPNESESEDKIFDSYNKFRVAQGMVPEEKAPKPFDLEGQEQPVQEEDVQNPDFEALSAVIQEQMSTKYAHPSEIACNRLIEYMSREEKLKYKFSVALNDAIIGAEEIIKITVDKDKVSTRNVNLLHIDYDLDNDTPFIHKANWFREERWLSVGTILDEFGEYLSDSEIQRIEEGNISSFGTGDQLGFAYEFNSMSRINSSNDRPNYIKVDTVCWRSLRKVGELRYIDPLSGEEVLDTVEDTYVMPKELSEIGATVKWEWIWEIWEGHKCGDIYINIRPLENQLPYLPYVGIVHNKLNSKPTSIVDLIKPHQIFYLIVWYRLELELAKAKGKKFIMDVAQLPKSLGWSVDQWMYHFDNLGVAWINSQEEGRQGDPNSIAKFNQFNSIDMSLSNIVGEYMQILSKLEEQIRAITGVSPQREGDIGRSETATGAQRAIIQSTNVTRSLFYMHDMFKEEVLNYMLEAAKIAYVDTDVLEYVTDSLTSETIKLDHYLLNTSTLGVYVSNSVEDGEKLDKLDEALNVAIQQGVANLKDLAQSINTKSLSEKTSILVSNVESREQQAQQQAEAEQQAAQEALDRADALQQMADDREDAREELKFEHAKELLVLEKQLSLQDSNNKIDLDKHKISIEDKQHSEDIQVKREDIKSKVEIAKNKPNPSKN